MRAALSGDASLSAARSLSAPSASAPLRRSAAGAPLPRLGPAQGNSVAAFGPVAVKPVATLACPIVSVLDRWLAESVQPAAMRWFGARVVEIKQISAYSCRGMNGNPNAHISEHAFGNALDIAAFTLADGRRISVKDGWKGMPEEQGFLHDVQATACQQFTTVLAPGSNVYHYDHIHVDLMRRASRRLICQPAAMSGEEVAARASGRNPYASREPMVTGSLGGKTSSHRAEGQRGRRIRRPVGLPAGNIDRRPSADVMPRAFQKVMNDTAQQIELVAGHRQRLGSSRRLPARLRRSSPRSPRLPCKAASDAMRRSGTGAMPPAAMRMNWNVPSETTARAQTSTSGHSA